MQQPARQIIEKLNPKQLFKTIAPAGEDEKQHETTQHELLDALLEFSARYEGQRRGSLFLEGN